MLFLQRENTKLTTPDNRYVKIPLKVDLIWTTPPMTQHFHAMFKIMCGRIFSSVATTGKECHEKALPARTRDKVFHNFSLRTKQF